LSLVNQWEKRNAFQLSYEDIQHYQKIIVALTETDRLMEEIEGGLLEIRDFQSCDLVLYSDGDIRHCLKKHCCFDRG
jgi:hypothetical protein